MSYFLLIINQYLLSSGATAIR